MSAALLDAPASLFAGRRPARAGGGRRTTLEELLDSTWRSVRADGAAECPICHAAMRLGDDHARCEGCGTTLS